MWALLDINVFELYGRNEWVGWTGADQKTKDQAFREVTPTVSIRMLARGRDRVIKVGKEIHIGDYNDQEADALADVLVGDGEFVWLCLIVNRKRRGRASDIGQI
jgi:hypothetical protein